jgi:hypothetical protein
MTLALSDLPQSVSTDHVTIAERVPELGLSGPGRGIYFMIDGDTVFMTTSQAGSWLEYSLATIRDEYAAHYDNPMTIAMLAAKQREFLASIRTDLVDLDIP